MLRASPPGRAYPVSCNAVHATAPVAVPPTPASTVPRHRPVHLDLHLLRCRLRRRRPRRYNSTRRACERLSACNNAEIGPRAVLLHASSELELPEPARVSQSQPEPARVGQSRISVTPHAVAAHLCLLMTVATSVRTAAQELLHVRYSFNCGTRFASDTLYRASYCDSTYWRLDSPSRRTPLPSGRSDVAAHELS